MSRERGGALRRTPAMVSASGVRSEENVPPAGALDTPPSTPAASRSPLRAIQPQGQPQPLGATPKKGSGLKEAARKGKKPTTGERSAEVRRPKVRDAILFWEENCNRNVQNVEKTLDLNARYRQELACRSSMEQDKEKIQSQIENELAKVITSLTEEVASLRQELDLSNKREEYYVSLLKRREEEICQLQAQLDQSKRVYASRLEELETKMQKMDAAAAAHGWLGCKYI